MHEFRYFHARFLISTFLSSVVHTQRLAKPERVNLGDKTWEYIDICEIVNLRERNFSALKETQPPQRLRKLRQI
jgi:hypothetical protein